MLQQKIFFNLLLILTLFNSNKFLHHKVIKENNNFCSVNLNIDSKFSKEDLESFEDSKKWWEHYGVKLILNQKNSNVDLILIPKESKVVLDMEKYVNTSVLAFIHYDQHPSIYIVMERLYGHESKMGVFNHEIGHLLGMKDNQIDPDSLMYYIYNGAPKEMAPIDLKDFNNVRHKFCN